MTLVLAGFLAGFVHVLSGPDHLAAIAPYAVDGRNRAWRTGVRWGFGHATGALAVGLLMLVLREALPVDAVSAWGERLVGLALIGIGIWGVRAALIRATQPLHAHGSHVHGHAALAVGTLHGLAGGAHLLGILPALALPSDIAAGSYLLLFGAGSVAAMGAFASLVGWVAGRPGVNGPRAQGALLGLSSLVTVAIGGFWLLGGP
jgi:hydrogenase/urease accessory protein HupE